MLGVLFIGSFIYKNSQTSEDKTLSEPNYYGLALMGLIPANQEDAHEYWQGDKDTGIVARDQNGNTYHLIKDAFGRTFLR